MAIGASAAQCDDAVNRLRSWTLFLVLIGGLFATAFAILFRVRADFSGTTALVVPLGGMLLFSRIWWDRQEHEELADALGAVAAASLGGMAGGAIAMLELRFHFPIADARLYAWDRALGVDGLWIVEQLVRHRSWAFPLMAPAYNYTVPIFFAGVGILAMLGDRVEAWRAAFCFVGTLLTTCAIALFFPAKGLGMWAPDSLISQMGPDAMRQFWPHFDEFYSGTDPILQVQAIDGVICFPSFHTVVGCLIFAMWRTRLHTRVAAGIFLSVMLLAIFPGGGHYFVDLLGGVTVSVLWFQLSLRVEVGFGDPPQLESAQIS